MYQAFFGLSASPFELQHDPRFLVATPRQTAALRLVEQGLCGERPLTVLLGQPGLGKTTILRAAMTSGRCNAIQCVHLGNPTLAEGTLVDLLLAELPAAATRPDQSSSDLEARLVSQRSRGRQTALVIDEAENLGAAALAELAMLVAMECEGAPLLPVVLAGLPALRARLERTRLHRSSAAVVPFELTRLDLAQTASFILARVRAAGAEPGALFTREAVATIHERARGVPRLVSVICDNVLYEGSSLHQKPVRRDTVARVCTRLDLDDPATSTAAARPHEPGDRAAG